MASETVPLSRELLVETYEALCESEDERTAVRRARLAGCLGDALDAPAAPPSPHLPREWFEKCEDALAHAAAYEAERSPEPGPTMADLLLPDLRAALAAPAEPDMAAGYHDVGHFYPRDEAEPEPQFGEWVADAEQDVWRLWWSGGEITVKLALGAWFVGGRGNVLLASHYPDAPDHEATWHELGHAAKTAACTWWHEHWRELPEYANHPAPESSEPERFVTSSGNTSGPPVDTHFRPIEVACQGGVLGVPVDLSAELDAAIDHGTEWEMQGRYWRARAEQAEAARVVAEARLAGWEQAARKLAGLQEGGDCPTPAPKCGVCALCPEPCDPADPLTPAECEFGTDVDADPHPCETCWLTWAGAPLEETP